MGKNISSIIKTICKKEGIKYTSLSGEGTNLEDARRLGEIVMEIECLVDELAGIFEKHSVKSDIAEEMEKELHNLHNVDHALLRYAYYIKGQNEEK